MIANVVPGEIQNELIAQLDWFSSLEILIEALAAASAFYIFLVHTFTAKHSFVNPRLFLDRNFTVGMLFIFIVGITYLASMALMTPYLQTLMGYPVVTAGLIMGPRGLGTMVSMLVVGRMIGRVDIRLLLMTGDLERHLGVPVLVGGQRALPQGGVGEVLADPDRHVRDLVHWLQRQAKEIGTVR